MSKTFAAALLCATAFAIKIRSTSTTASGDYDIHTETLFGFCENFMKHNNDDDLRNFFRMFDSDSDGIISLKEFRGLYAHDFEDWYAEHDEYVHSFISTMDGNDGINEREFIYSNMCNFDAPMVLWAYRWADLSENGTKYMDPEVTAVNFAS